MFWKKQKPLEPLSIRHTQVAEGKKVRYFVYRSETEFVAVVAESALMALRISEVKEPVKIVRDLPMTGKEPLMPERLIPAAEKERVALPLVAAPEKSSHAEVPPAKDRLAGFREMKLAELHAQKSGDVFIFSPESVLAKLKSDQA